MEITIKKENVESIYELVYDKENIENLISNIIKNCSIRKRIKTRIEASSYDNAESIINSATDWNGNKIYENASDITEEPVEDPFDYWRHGDPVPFSFTADTLLSPELVQFLIDLLNEEEIDYEWFNNREELSERDKLQLEMQKLNSEINTISNFEPKTKIKKLEELFRTIQYFNSIPEFDLKLLSNYYDLAQSYINLELIQETIKYQKKLTTQKYTDKKQD